MRKKSKIDPDLQSKLNRKKPNDRVSVIATYKKRTLTKVRAYLRSQGIKLNDETDLLKNFEMFSVTMIVKQIRDLAKQDFITLIS